MFFLPDVASASIADLELVWVAVSVTFTVGEDDKANTVGFAVTDSIELTETLKLYCITNNTLPFITYNIYIYIYIYILNVINMIFIFVSM